MELHELRTALRDLQGDRCGICGVTDVGTTLDLDHDHASGFVRGLLCRACNLAEGRHGAWCDIPQDCPICTWRATPAVSWLGVTVHMRRPDVVRRNTEFATSKSIVSSRNNDMRMVRDVLSRAFGDAS